MPIKKLPPLQVRDLFDPSKLPSKEIGQKILNLAIETTTNSSSAIFNTFEALEPDELEMIRDQLVHNGGIPAFAVGPLHKLMSSKGDGAETSLLNQDRGCIEWLDTQALGSVLYVSFGSVVHVTRDELAEMAWGLANSGKPFLCGDGRNSTLESIYEGVPMLSRPIFGDQLPTGRYVQDTWKIGILLEGVLEREEVEKTIKRLLGEDEGVEIRGRAKVLKEKMRMSLESSGSSQQAVDKLINHILSL